MRTDPTACRAAAIRPHRVAWLEGRGCARAALALALGAGAMLCLSGRASAVSSADAQYAAVLRLAPDLDRGAQLFSLCAACHGRDGGGSIDGTVPAIAGQFSPVLVREVIEFRYGVRHSMRAEGFISGHQLSSQDLADVAAYASSLQPRWPPPGSEAAQTAYAAALFGNLCAGCHGARGEGGPDRHVPRLAGQHSEYLVEQLGEAAQGGRPGMQRDHASLLRKLRAGDINALAGYLAGIAPTGNPAARLLAPSGSTH